MLVHLLEQRVLAALRRCVASRAYIGVVAAVAFGLTVSMTMPFAPVLVCAVLLNPG